LPVAEQPILSGSSTSLRTTKDPLHQHADVRILQLRLRRHRRRTPIAAAAHAAYGDGETWGLLTLWTRTRCMAENAPRKVLRQRRVGYPASPHNAAMGVFGLS